MIAWKMQGRRPTLSVDFFKSIPHQVRAYDTTVTAARLNGLATLSGTITTANGAPLNAPVTYLSAETDG